MRLESVYTQHHPHFGEGRFYAEHGYIHYGVDSRRKRVFIHNVEVEAAFRGAGIGLALLRTVASTYPAYEMDLGYTTDAGEALWQSYLRHEGKGLPKSQKCKYCESPATHRTLWAEGMAYIPTCEPCLPKAKRKIEVDNNDEIVKVMDIPKTATLNDESTLPPAPGESPIPKGHVRLFHYTHRDNIPSIRENGLLESHARGDGNMGAGNEPSAGVWASTREPREGNSFVEFHAHPDQISQRAEHPGGRDAEEWGKGYHHVIMKGDVHPSQFSAIHEPWHSHARCMQSQPRVNEAAKAGEYDHLKSDPDYGKAIEHIQRTASDPRQHLANPVDGTDEWHHGTPAGNDITQHREYDDDEGDGDYEPDSHTHWNSYLGDHFTSLPHVAETFARAGFHHRYSDKTNAAVHTAKLGIHNPKQYPKETQMDTEALGHAWDKHDYHDPMGIHDEKCPNWSTCAGHHEHTLGDSTDNAMKKFYSSPHHAAHWLTSHPEKQEIAERFKNHLEGQGHDGVVYGNEVEGPKDHPCAIAFEKNQIHPVNTRKVSFRNDYCKCCGGTGEHTSGRECYRCDGGLGVPESEVADKPAPCDGVVSEQSGRKDWAVVGVSAYRPTEKIFGPTKEDLDPRLFEGDHMRDYVRNVIMGMLDGHFAALGFADWKAWTRVYLAGSESTFWWGNRDFDTLLALNYGALMRAHPEFHERNLQQISDYFNQGFRESMNSEEWRAPWDPEPEDWHITFFINPMSWDIADIKPYGAYSISDDKWVVRPPHLPQHSADDFDKSTWPLAESYADRIRTIVAMPPGGRRRGQAKALLEFLHSDRGRAFSPRGHGWNDIGNVVWKYLDVHPEHLLEQLIAASKHQNV